MDFTMMMLDDHLLQRQMGRRVMFMDLNHLEEFWAMRFDLDKPVILYVDVYLEETKLRWWNIVGEGDAGGTGDGYTGDVYAEVVENETLEIESAKWRGS
ncbi:hypothetical protein LguiA_004704 [Lonicera macranthoides]